MTIQVPETVKKIMQLLSSYSYEIYLVGGAVRDQIMGQETNDYDLCTNMPLEEIQKLFPSFVIMNENDHRHTGTIRIDNQIIEISSFHGNSLEEDLHSRDITINAIACDKDGNIVDPYHGREDIEKGIIRLVDKEGKGIDRDPLRILRVLRFAGRFHFQIDDNTKSIIHQKKELIKTSAKERIYKEFAKILVSDQATNLIREYQDIFCEMIPELKECIHFEQNNDYHIYDVFEHTLKVMENTPPILSLRLAALFHDIGKPACYKEGEDGVGHFLGHEVVSRAIFARFATEYRIDNKTKELIKKLIWYHDKELSLKSAKINNFFRDYGLDQIDLVFLLKEADIKGQNPKYNDRLESLKRVKEKYISKSLENPCISIKDLKINGRKLMEMGFFDRKIGIILKDVLDQVTNESIINEEDSIEEYVSNHYK